jgi:hypothetical protein
MPITLFNKTYDERGLYFYFNLTKSIQHYYLTIRIDVKHHNLQKTII